MTFDTFVPSFKHTVCVGISYHKWCYHVKEQNLRKTLEKLLRKYGSDEDFRVFLSDPNGWVALSRATLEELLKTGETVADVWSDLDNSLRPRGAYMSARVSLPS